MRLAIRVLTFGIIGKRDPAPPVVEEEDERLTTQDREDTRTRYLAACDELERVSNESLNVSNKTIELMRLDNG